MFRTTVTLFVVLFVATESAVAEEKKGKVGIGVEVLAAGDSAEISSYLGKHLRAIDDVEINNEMPLYLLTVTREQMRDSRGYFVGRIYFITVSCGIRYMWVLASAKPEHKEIVDELVRMKPMYSRPEIFSIQVAQDSDTETVCKKIVASFDGKYLEPLRNGGAKAEKKN